MSNNINPFAVRPAPEGSGKAKGRNPGWLGWYVQPLDMCQKTGRSSAEGVCFFKHLPTGTAISQLLAQVNVIATALNRWQLLLTGRPFPIPKSEGQFRTLGDECDQMPCLAEVQVQSPRSKKRSQRRSQRRSKTKVPKTQPVPVALPALLLMLLPALS